MTDLHTCSPYCTLPACVLAQRDALRDRLAKVEDLVASAKVWARTRMGSDAEEEAAVTLCWAVGLLEMAEEET